MDRPIKNLPGQNLYIVYCLVKTVGRITYIVLVQT